MAQFKAVPTTHILSIQTVEGLNATGSTVRLDLVVTKKTTYLQHSVDGLGFSTTQFNGARREDAPTAFEMACLQFITTRTAPKLQLDPVAELVEVAPPAETEPVAEPVVEVAPPAETEPVAEPVVEVAPPAETEPVAEPVRRQRGPIRPDSETPVWAEGDLAVVMVQGRSFRYDLRRGADTIESVVATRSWRTERQALIAKAHDLLAVA